MVRALRLAIDGQLGHNDFPDIVPQEKSALTKDVEARCEESTPEFAALYVPFALCVCSVVARESNVGIDAQRASFCVSRGCVWVA